LGSSNIFLFTNQFPYANGETFLDAEVSILSKSVKKILFFPQIHQEKPFYTIPEGSEVADFEWNQNVKLKILIRKYWNVIILWWASEFIRSPHRWKYLLQFRWNWNRFLGLLDAADRLKEFLFKQEPGIYYSYWFNEWATILAIAKDMGLKGKFITRAHGYDFDEAQQSRGYHPFRYTEWKKFDKILQVSQFGMKYMEEKFGMDEKLFVSKLGTKDYGTGPIPQTGPFQLVSCSNFVTLKRIPLLAEMLSKLQVDFHWVHFGDGVEKESVITEVKQFLPENRFTFQGYISNDKLMKYYMDHEIDLFLNFSILEGIPVSMMEAISFGIPILGCNICGIPEIVNSDTGLILPTNLELKKVAELTENFLLNKSRDPDYRKGVREFWQKNYHADLNYQEFLNHHLLN